MISGKLTYDRNPLVNLSRSLISSSPPIALSLSSKTEKQLRSELSSSETFREAKSSISIMIRTAWMSSRYQAKARTKLKTDWGESSTGMFHLEGSDFPGSSPTS